MIYVILSELAVPLDDLTPDEEHFRLIPSVALRGLPVHNQIQKTGLKIPKDDDKRTHGTSIHDEVVDEMVFAQRLMQGYFIQTLFQPGISKAIKFVNFGHIVVVASCGDVKINLRVILIVVVKDRADGCLKIKLDTLIQLEVSQGIHDTAFNTNRVHFDCVFT